MIGGLGKAEKWFGVVVVCGLLRHDDLSSGVRPAGVRISLGKGEGI